MKNYQAIFNHASEMIQYGSPDIGSVVQRCSSQYPDIALFIQCGKGEATHNGTTGSFIVSNTQLLDHLLQKHQVKYVVVLDTIGERPYDKLLPSPHRVHSPEKWNIHLWELYRDLYHESEKQALERSKLRVVYSALLFSGLDLFKTRYSNKTLVNIFGWLVCPQTRVLSDLYLDMFYCYGE